MTMKMTKPKNTGSQCDEQRKTSIGLYIEKDVLNDIEKSLPHTNCTSRNEFIIEAIRFYISVLNRDNYSDLLTPAFESVVKARIRDSEERIARVMFKQGVEIAMMMHIIAATSGIEPEKLDLLRKLCVDEISRLGGKYSLDDAVKFQRG